MYPGSPALGSTVDCELLCEVFIDTDLVNGKHADFHVIDLAGSAGADVIITNPTAPSHLQRCWDEVRSIRKCEQAKWGKHVLSEVTMVPLVLTTSALPGTPVTRFFCYVL